MDGKAVAEQHAAAAAALLSPSTSSCAAVRYRGAHETDACEDVHLLPRRRLRLRLRSSRLLRSWRSSPHLPSLRPSSSLLLSFHLLSSPVSLPPSLFSCRSLPSSLFASLPHSSPVFPPLRPSSPVPLPSFVHSPVPLALPRSVPCPSSRLASPVSLSLSLSFIPLSLFPSLFPCLSFSARSLPCSSSRLCLTLSLSLSFTSPPSSVSSLALSLVHSPASICLSLGRRRASKGRPAHNLYGWCRFDTKFKNW